MLVLSPTDLFTKNAVTLRNRRDGKTVFSKAYPVGACAEFELAVDRSLGIFAPKMCLHADGEQKRHDYPFRYLRTDGICDIFSLSLSLCDIRSQPALLFFRILFSDGGTTLYFGSDDNVSGILSYTEGDTPEFRMLLYDGAFAVPEWFYDCVMYHIFVDRFAKGPLRRTGRIPQRADAIYTDDWYGGIPQYGNHPGDDCKNNLFFGGTLDGIAEKLDGLAALGVNVLYLSPIFEAYSNHKYDTGDYTRIDEMFGGEAAFDTLLLACREKGIRVILDGVFNHTGDDSVYFNKYGRYGSGGAYRDPDSEYRHWYLFSSYPDEYECWWGVRILPKLNTKNEKVVSFFAGRGGIVSRYLRRGVSGFRLDVADELPDAFLETLRETAKEVSPDALLLGEVWENAADKCAYGARRKYFQGRQLDGVMNYPIRAGIIAFLTRGDAAALCRAVCDVYASYPECASLALMNLLGTHDTERILTVLATDRYQGLCGDELAHFRLTDAEYETGVRRLLCASVLQFTLPGVPSVYYGDEAGMQGGRDPFCRMPYPWGKEDRKLLSHYRRLGALRRREPALCRGMLSAPQAKDGCFSFLRTYGDECILTAVNMGNHAFRLPLDASAQLLFASDGAETPLRQRFLPPQMFAVIKMTKAAQDRYGNRHEY